MPRVIFNICIIIFSEPTKYYQLSGLETAFLTVFFVQRTCTASGYKYYILKLSIPYNLYSLVQFCINRVSMNVSVESKANISD